VVQISSIRPILGQTISTIPILGPISSIIPIWGRSFIENHGADQLQNRSILGETTSPGTDQLFLTNPDTAWLGQFENGMEGDGKREGGSKDVERKKIPKKR
jgi:hypothetical protein